MAAQLEVLPDPADQILGLLGPHDPVLEDVLAQALLAGAHQQDGAAVLHRVLGIVQSLLGLVKVQILGSAALGHDHDVGPLGDLLLIEAVQERAAFPVGLGHIAGHGLDDLLLLIQDHVQDEVHAADVGGLFDVLTQGIGGDVAGAGQGVDHHGVVRLDGGPGGDAGHDGLGAAGIAGEVVIFDVAQADPAVGLGHLFHDVHRGATGGDAHGDGGGGVAVDAADLVIGPLAGQLQPLGIGVLPVAAQGEDQGDILLGHAAGIELVQQSREHLVAGAGAGDIAGDDGDLLAGPDDILQAGRADGSLQSPLDLRLTGQIHGDGIGGQDAQDVLLRHFDLLGTGAKTKF